MTTKGTLINHTHSHPANALHNPSPGDIFGAGIFSNRQKTPIKFSVFHVDTKSYVPYNQFSSSFEMDEIIIKSKKKN